MPKYPNIRPSPTSLVTQTTPYETVWLITVMPVPLYRLTFELELVMYMYI